MFFVKANPHEYLVVARRGKLVNLGIAGKTLLWPGSSYVLIPSIKQEATFAMTQETKDGIPLRFKGIVIYRVVQPEIAARHFDFTKGTGHEEIKTLINHLCLGKLRAVVSHLTMAECIEQRDTTLTGSVESSLREVATKPQVVDHEPGSPEEHHGEMSTSKWGVVLEVVQVAQVFIIDDKLRRQLEAEVRDKIEATSELSQIQMREKVKMAKILSDRSLAKQDLETEKQRKEIAREKLLLEQKLEMEKAEAEAALQLLKNEKKTEVLDRELHMRRLLNQVTGLRVEGDMLAPRAEQDLQKEILELEKSTEVAKAMAGIFQGANLSIYGEDAKLMSALIPAINILADQAKKSFSDS